MTQHRLTLVALVLVAASALSLGAQTRRFFPDDPIWREPMTQDVKTAARYEPDLAYQTIENLFLKPGDPVTGQRAKNINTVDEVPDGPYFVNRAGRMPLTPAMVARAANTSDGPAPGKWTVVSAKSDGVTPGFTIRDAANQLWFVKFDPPGWRAHGDRQRDRRRETVLGGRLSHRRIPHRAAGAGESRDRQGHAHHAAGRNGAADEPGRHLVAAVARRSRSRRLVSRHSQQGHARPPGRTHPLSRHPRRRSERRRRRTSTAASCAAISCSPRGSITSTPRASTRCRRSSPRTAAASSVTTCSTSARRSAAPPSGRARDGKATKRWSRSPARSASACCRSASRCRCGARRIISNRRRSAGCRAITPSGIPKRGGRTSPTPRSATCVPTTRSGRRRRWRRSPTT